MFILGFVVNTNEFATTRILQYSEQSNFKHFENNLNHIEVNIPKHAF